MNWFCLCTLLISYGEVGEASFSLLLVVPFTSSFGFYVDVFCNGGVISETVDPFYALLGVTTILLWYPIFYDIVESSLSSSIEATVWSSIVDDHDNINPKKYIFVWQEKKMKDVMLNQTTNKTGI